MEDRGWNEDWIKIGMIYLIARAVYPASDRKTADWVKRNSGLCELYNIEPRKINRHKFYKVSKKLDREKEGIERYLNNKTGELFSRDLRIMIYDLTNTYFEGEKRGSKKARYGRSKERRNDKKIISLGMVVDRWGFVIYSKIYKGNIRDSKTLKGIIEEMRKNSGRGNEKRVIVIDRGIATEENLRMLKENGYEYICVSLSKPEIKEEEIKDLKVIKDKSLSNIYVKWVEVEGSEDNYLYVKSEKKEKKEVGMEELHCKRYEEGLRGVERGIKKKGGIKRLEKVYERLGRLKEKYPSVHRLYKVEVKKEGGKAVDISWEKKGGGKKREGVYYIRTTLKGKEEKTIFEIYNTIREVEATFRVLKTDLKLRPICHKEDEFSEAHINGSVIAYTIVNSIRHPLKARGIHKEWSEIVRIMNTQKVVTTSMKSKSGHTIYIKRCSEPEREVKEIYHYLSYTDRPFWQKKAIFLGKDKGDVSVFDTS